ncbi:MAG: CARDB domain-containing protein [Planctomycetota bacterium]
MPKGDQKADSYAAVPEVFEHLEQRTLLAGDLAGSFAAFEEPTQLAGARIELELFIGNQGSSDISGTLEVDLYASRDGTLNKAEDPFISREKVRGRLVPGDNAFVAFRVNVPLSLPAGDWRAIAVLDPDNKLPESSTANNTLVSQVGTIVVPDYDLAGALADLKFPSAIIAGNAAKGSVRVAVSNPGTVATPKAAAADVKVYARLASAANTASVLGGDILLGEATNQKLGGIKPGSKPKAVNIKLESGVGLASGTYKLVVAVDAGGDLAETNESNNVSVLTGETFTVAPPFFKLDAGVSDKAKLPTAVVSGDGTKIRLPITVANTGNVPLDTGQTIDIQVFADKVGGGSTLLTTLDDVSISKLAPGKPKGFNLNLLLPPGLSDGDYRLRVLVDSSGDVTQSSTADNDASTTQTISVAEGFIKLDTAISDKAKLPTSLIAGDGAKIRLPASITNNGNVPLEKGQTIDIQVFADRAGGGSTLLTTVDDFSISGLRSGRAKNVNLNVELPPSLSNGDYTLRVVADSSGDVTQSTTAGNAASTTASITVAEPFVQLQTEVSDKAKLPASVISGDGTKIKLPVSITNNGNVSMDKSQTVDIEVFADRAGGGSTRVASLDDVSLGSLKPGQAKRLNLNVELPAGLTDGSYKLRVQTDFSGDVTESSTAGSIDVNEGVATADVSINLKALPSGSLEDGALRILQVGPATVTFLELPLEVTNNGNVTFDPGTDTDILLALRPSDGASDGSDDVLIGSEFQVLDSLKPGQTRRFDIEVLVPADSVPPGDYEIVSARGRANLDTIFSVDQFGPRQPIGNGDFLVKPL